MLDYFWSSHHIKYWTGRMLNNAKSVDLRTPFLDSPKTPLLGIHSQLPQNWEKTRKPQLSLSEYEACEKRQNQSNKYARFFQILTYNSSPLQYSLLCSDFPLVLHPEVQYYMSNLEFSVLLKDTGQEDLNFQPFNCQGQPTRLLHLQYEISHALAHK